MVKPQDKTKLPLTASHWGTYRVESTDGQPTALHGFEEDIDSSPIGHGILDVLSGPTRITTPVIRKSWLDGGPGTANDKRGCDSFVRVSWDTAFKLVADELTRVRDVGGNEAIYGGSYGWANAGRFHHAQSQLHRFLNCIGGYTKSVNSYSLAAGEVILPHVLGNFAELIYNPSSWQSIIESTELFVALGGMPIRNSQISSGGVGRHRTREALTQAANAGVELVNISPIKSDLQEELTSQWIAPRPNTDVALLLAVAHTLIVEDLHNKQFLQTHTVGFSQFNDYVTGKTDGVEKSAAWASKITEIDANVITSLSRKMANSRTMITAGWALTRQDHGEQPFWAAISVAAMLGQIGLPGGGIAFGYSAANSAGLERQRLSYPAFAQGTNPVSSFIPVARISDMLMNSGAAFDYNGQQYIYPDIKLIYWAGGNPFHHHQDLTHLLQAWQKPDTIIAHEWCWNALAKHADIVLPCTTTIERQDIAMTPRDPYIVVMERVVAPAGDARNDYDIFSGIAKQMGVIDAFTENRTAQEWTAKLYEGAIQSAAVAGVALPPLDELVKKQWHKVEVPDKPHVLLADFRKDPLGHPLETPSGKIELYSSVIEQFNYDDCAPHAAWFEPQEWLGATGKAYPLHLISNQPKNKLHSQLDHGQVSRAGKIHGREPITINAEDAKQRNIKTNDAVRVFNSRGACLAVAITSDAIRPGVVQMSTGAWMDIEIQPDNTLLCKHGNPNLLTLDKGTSKLAQGPTAHSCLVQIERFDGELPALSAFEPPIIK